MQISVTPITFGPLPKVMVRYGQYMTTCYKRDIWAVAKELKKLPVSCPKCKRKL